MSEFSQENVINAARDGDEEAMNELISALAPTVESIASAYVGRCPLTRNDLIQEGMIGLLGSVYGYSADGGAQFASYAKKCIAYRIMSAVRNQLRDKHAPLNEYVVFDNLDISDSQADPQMIVDMREQMSNLYMRIEDKLTTLERDVIILHIQGHSYNSIAEILNVSVKSVDGALQRARSKLKE